MFRLNSGIFEVLDKEDNYTAYHAINIIDNSGIEKILMFTESNGDFVDIMILPKGICKRDFTVGKQISSNIKFPLLIQLETIHGIKIYDYIDKVADTFLKKYGLSENEVKYIKDGKVLAAVKEVKERLGLGLKESKDLVDKFKSEVDYKNLKL